MTAQARREAYWQEDHVRLYGTDLPARIDDAGFRTTVVRFTAELGPAARSRYGLLAEDELYLARPRAG